jgi:NAD(P)-dependent dehydrogenase (short-subunit alcohol dehydrogenase family)
MKKPAAKKTTAAKTVVITGAARGIGLAAAERFLQEGWQVAMFDVLMPELQAAAKGLGEPKRILTHHCDVRSPESVKAAFEAVDTRFGRIDALVNNAGIADFGTILETSLEVWTNIMATNLTGPFLCSQEAGRRMAARGAGAIVNIGSISGLRASTLRVAYGTSKAGIIHLTKQQAVELGEFGIRSNCICPGPVDTAMAKKVHTQAIRNDYHDHMPLNRYGLESELAASIYFLCSDEASYITGQVLAVDGGFDSTGIGLPTLRAMHRQKR